jgi:hypothetical protein
MRNKIFHEFSRVLLPIFIRQNKIIPIILLLTLSWSKYQQTIHPKKVSILLMSRYRGGSSFLGNMLNQNKNLVYFFEPLAVYGHGDDQNIHQKVFIFLSHFNFQIIDYFISISQLCQK